MDPELKALVEIVTNAPGGVEVYSLDILPLQREAAAQGVIITAKKVPYTYINQKGYTWQHQNSRVYNLTINANG